MRVLLVSLVLCASACQFDLSTETEAAARSREALGSPYQLQDIGTPGYQNSSGPIAFTAVPSSTRTAFFATTPTEGYEPWVTDGTAAGTMLLADILPGVTPSGANYPGNPLSSRWVTLGNALYTRATERAGNTLWRTDGTPAGTQRVFDGESISFGPEAMSTQLLFSAKKRLYVSDGTTAGTASTVTMNCDPQLMNGAPSFTLIACRGSDYVTRAWASNGTAGGTVLLLDAGIADSFGNVSMKTIGTRAFFFAPSGSNLQLWSSDGTAAGTTMVSELVGVSTARVLIASGPLLYFQAGGSVWVSDGTSAGTHAIRSVYNDKSAAVGPQGLVFMAAFNQLWATDGADAGLLATMSVDGEISSTGDTAWWGSGLKLWATNGTVAGTRQVYGPNAGNADNFGIGGDGRAYFGANESLAAGIEPWVTDGTDAGTKNVLDLVAVQSPSKPKNFVSAGNVAVFTTENPYGLWRTDGTVNGTAQLTPGVSVNGFWQGPWFGASKGWIYFMDSNGVQGTDLFRTNGTVVEAAEVMPGNTTSVLFHSWSANDLGFFVSVSGGPSYGTSRLVGFPFSSGAPSLVVDWPASSTADAPRGLTQVGDAVFFTGTTPDAGAQLWRTDGRSIVPVTPFSGTLLGEFGGKLYFSNTGGIYRLECDNSTTRVPGTYSVLGTPVVTRGGVFFTAQTNQGRVLLKYDGLTVSTVPLGDAGTAFYAEGLSAWNDRVVYRLSESVVTNFGSAIAQVQLYVSDGTVAGTKPVTNQPVELTYIVGNGVLGESVYAVQGGSLYAAVITRDAGSELWEFATDGGAKMVGDIQPGVRGSDPKNFAVVGGTLVFSADNGSGAEPWAVSIDRSPVTPSSSACVFTWPDAGPWDAGEPAPEFDAGAPTGGGIGSTGGGSGSTGGGVGATGGGVGATGGGVGSTGGGVGATGGGVGATGGGVGATGGGIGATGGGVGATGGGVGSTGGGIGATGGGIGATGGGIGATGGGIGATGGGDGTTGGGVGATGGGDGATGGGTAATGGGDGTTGGGTASTGGGNGTTGGGTAATGGGDGTTGGGSATTGGGSGSTGGGGTDQPAGCGCSSVEALEWLLGVLMLVRRRRN